MIENDEAYFGGIYNIGTLTLIRSRVSDHGAGYPDEAGIPIQGMGGGIHNTGTATLVDSVVPNNITDYDGDGIKDTGTRTLGPGSRTMGPTTVPLEDRAPAAAASSVPASSSWSIPQ